MNKHIGRREFLQLCGGMFLAQQFVNVATACSKTNAEGNIDGNETMPGSLSLNIREVKIAVGCEPFTALHVSDSHIVRVDQRDSERKRALGANRMKIFGMAESCFEAAVRYACEHDMMLLHTGDMYDFVSEANIEFAAEWFRKEEWFACAGNHEYSQFVGEAKEDEAYKAQSYAKVQAAFPNDLTFASHVVNGVNFIALDDVYYNFTERQHELMEQEVQKGLPIVMMCHVPIYTPELCADIQKGDKTMALGVTGAPENVTSAYAGNASLPPAEQWRNRGVQQHADNATLEFIAWLKEQKQLKAILTGHLHHFYESRFSPTAMQYVVGACYNRDVFAVHFV